MLKLQLNKDPKETLSTVNTVVMDRLACKSLRCLQSHMMLSANKLRPPKVLSKATHPSHLSLSLSHNLGLSPPLLTSSLRTTLPIPNSSAMRTIATISNSTANSKDPKAKMDPPLSNAATQDTMVHKPRTPRNSPRALHKPLSLAMQLPERVKTVATPLQTRLRKANNQLPPKALNLNQAISNNHKLVTTHTVILTTKARTMLLGTNTNRDMAATILVDHTAPKVVTNHIKATECPLLLHMSILHLQLQVALELLHFMAVIVLSEVFLSMVVQVQLRPLRLRKDLVAVEPSVDMMHLDVALPIKDKVNSITTVNRVLNQVPVMS